MWGHLTRFDDDVFEKFERMRRRMDRLCGAWSGSTGIRSVAAGTFPGINVGASPEPMDVYVFAAGVDPKSLDISLQQSLLGIAAGRKAGLPEKAQVYRNERSSGGFQRVVTLPEDVDPDKVDAAYHDGVPRSRCPDAPDSHNRISKAPAGRCRCRYSPAPVAFSS